MARARPRRRRFDAGLYRATTKSPAAAASSRCSITAHGGEQVRQRDGAEVVTQRRPGQRRRAVHRGHPPAARRSRCDAQPGSVAVSIRSNTSAAMAYTPRIARADQRHPVTAGGQRERPIHALRLLSERIGMADLAAARRQHVEITPDSRPDGWRRRRPDPPRGFARPACPVRARPPSTPRGARPSRMASIGDGASPIAQVARPDLVLATRNVPSAPAAARAAASETPWQPTSRNTAADGLASRGVRASRVEGSKNRAGSPEGLRQRMDGRLVRLQVEREHSASDRADRFAPANVRSTRSPSSLAGTPRSQPTPSANRRR